jgi:M6 family metalloprotease-like protein
MKNFRVRSGNSPFTRTKIPLIIFVILVLLAGGGAVTFAALNQTPNNQNSLTGTLTAIHGDPAPGSSLPSSINFYLTDDAGVTTQLEISPAVLQSAGGLNALDRKRVVVNLAQAQAGAIINSNGVPVVAIRLEQPANGALANPDQQALVSGSKAYANIRCKFPDINDSRETTDWTATYFGGMFGETYPGLGHYWREVSYNNVDLAGTSTPNLTLSPYGNPSGWVTLPQPRSYYVVDPASPNLTALANDCTQAADSQFNFYPYFGLNLIFNSDIGTYAWGGSRYLSLDGMSKVWPVTWEPPWGFTRQSVFAHEMGHSFGLPHSAYPPGSEGAPGNEYKNSWDVMSNAYIYLPYYPPGSPNYGYIGQHTITYHKDRLGWIPADRKLVYNGGSSVTLTLDRLAQPAGSNYLMAQIPINGSTSLFYTVELRIEAGYDGTLPLDGGVIIHQIDTTTNRREPAWIVDPANNSSSKAQTPEAIWTAGETYILPENQFRVEVISIGANSAVITLRSGPVPIAPTSLTASPVNENTIGLSWSDNSNNETGFKIERSPNGSSSWSQIATVSANITSYNDTGLELATTYQYRVAAYNTYGYSDFSSTATGSTRATPYAPTNLTGFAISTTEIRLNWTDNSQVETGYYIQRWPDKNDENNWGFLNTTVDNAGTYIDNYLTKPASCPGPTYQYRVRAYLVSNYSNWSNEISVTLGCPGTTVSVSDDNGSGTDNNTFSKAIKDATAGQVISLTVPVTLTAPLQFTPKPGVIISGGCNASGPTQTISIPTGSLNVLTLLLKGGVTLSGVSFRGIILNANTTANPQSYGPNKLVCVKTDPRPPE